MKKMRVNQEDISNFIAEKIFQDINKAYDWMESEIKSGTQIFYYNSYLISENYPTIIFSDVKSFNEWRKPLNVHREELLKRINNLKSGKTKNKKK